MTIDQQTIDHLSDRLTGASDTSPLTDEERALLFAALTQLATSQAIIAGQNRLLELHSELGAQIDSIPQAAIGGLRAHLEEPGPVDAFDLAAAQLARRKLLDEIESANSKRATLAAVLSFVRTFGGLAA